MTNDDHFAGMAIHYTQIWATAATTQAQRIIHSRQAQHDEELHELEELGIEDPSISITGLYAREADAYLFVMALHQLRLAALLLRRSLPKVVSEELRCAIERFDAAVPDAKRIRDALAHFDDYLHGEGRLHRMKSSPTLEVTYSTEISLSDEGGFGNVRNYWIRVSLTPDLPNLAVEVITAGAAAFRLHNELRRLHQKAYEN